ncbi:tetrahydrofolate dehydrogenase/cyclohydrolase catalytic domain-containing protein, partial [Francisella tularensis]|uniref:tetrahydrofolate dehydrogenase/cyclohydrolase catalytic domain-containing protein n=1 Tax=Francisella tularensis TaxID=263 RepID=UPI002381A24A
TYVASKEKACAQVGIDSQVITRPEHTTESELLELIDHLNNDSSVHAILVQLPLPAHINKNNEIYSIKPEKDVDGFH